MTEWFARPVLHVSNVEASLRFYVDRLGFTVAWRYEEDGRACVAQVDRSTCALILSDQWPSCSSTIRASRLPDPPFCGSDYMTVTQSKLNPHAAAFDTGGMSVASLRSHRIHDGRHTSARPASAIPGQHSRPERTLRGGVPRVVDVRRAVCRPGSSVDLGTPSHCDVLARVRPIGGRSIHRAVGILSDAACRSIARARPAVNLLAVHGAEGATDPATVLWRPASLPRAHRDGAEPRRSLDR